MRWIVLSPATGALFLGFVFLSLRVLGWVGWFFVRDLLAAYLDSGGRVVVWPSRRRRDAQEVVLAYLAGKFEEGRIYREGEVNGVILEWCVFSDYALLRRELFEAGYPSRERDGSGYWRVGYESGPGG